MSMIPRFVEYAGAFEKAYASDDWSPIGPFFADDAVYEIRDVPAPIGGRFEGRAAILAYFKRVLDGFDRRFASRAIELVDGPHEKGASVHVRGKGVYTSDRAPNFAFELEEIATFDAQGRIVRLEDRYDARNVRAFSEYLRAHGKKLGIAAA